MSKSNGPGVLLRVSHLLLIQIFFIFAVLGLILFYPGQDDQTTPSIAEINNSAMETSKRISNIIEERPDKAKTDSSLVASIEGLVFSQTSIREFKLYRFENDNYLQGRTLLKMRDGEYLTDDTLTCKVSTASAKLIKEEPGNIHIQVSPDGDELYYYYLIPDSGGDILLRLITANHPHITAQNNLPEIILLLFLISTLISLLIINLISSGVKRPLKDIISAFNEMGSGQQTLLEDNATDPDIRQLTYAFNGMSQSLIHERKKLAGANKQLMKANQSLVESESILTALVDYSPDAIVVTDLDDQILIYNQTAAGDFGYNQANLTGKRISTVFSLSQIKKEATDETHNHLGAKEVICRRSDGGKFPALLVSTPLGAEGSKPIAMLYFFRNISESRNYQEMVLKLDRIASRGKMARDIAHEINNYLAILQGNIELLPMIIAKNDEDKIHERIDVLKKAVSNILTFTEGLTRFSDENSEFAKEDLNQLLENLIAFLKPQNKYDNIYIGTNLSEYLPMVTIDSSQIQLVVTNILGNAAEALETAEDKKWIAISTALDESGKHVYLKIANSGPPINSENINKLFVNRFSTKRDGNGLGLITCKNIVDNHNGEISFHSTHEAKAIFVLKIPINRNVEDDDPTVQMTAPAEAAN